MSVLELCKYLMGVLFMQLSVGACFFVPVFGGGGGGGNLLFIHLIVHILVNLHFALMLRVT